ncbi:hypothetical protein BLA60_33835 [Actinophytocola xinjiangensis]|uniref:Uncharacterized protein n=1 Tax=Actinophytocola xinjiangensis TaxID=485602 RepID=A0A7Z0WG29_9PSEU|nr:hypothetical protein [Actinophytocola xinjiangensis]OLF06027.1 hypothetical protein BLA60_33835 [Actinophytocola xinjiangensis]
MNDDNPRTLIDLLDSIVGCDARTWRTATLLLATAGAVGTVLLVAGASLVWGLLPLAALVPALRRGRA